MLWAGLAFVAALALSLVLADTATPAAVLKLAALGAYVLLPWVMSVVLTDDQRLAWAVGAWLAGLMVAIAVGLAGIAAFAIDRSALTSLGCSYGRLPMGPYPRVCIPFRNPNLFANYLAASVPMLVACGALILPKGARAAVIVATDVVCVSTLSTGIGGVALAAGLTVWWTRRLVAARRRALAAVALAAGITVAAAFAVATVGHSVPRGQGQVSIGSFEWHFLKGPRVHTWLSTVGTIREHPVTGLGYGSLVARTAGRDLSGWIRADLASPLEAGDRPPFAEAHNVWLSVAGQSGLLGLAAFLVLLGIFIRRMTIRPLPSDGPLAGLPSALVAAVIGTLAFHGLFVAGEEARHLWALFGLIGSAASVRAGRERAQGPTRDRMPAS